MKKLVLAVAVFFALNLACSLTPASAENVRALFLYNQGVVFQEYGHFDKAIEAYEKALALDPKLTDAYYSLGRSYYAKAAEANGIDRQTGFAASGDPAQQYKPKWDKSTDELELAAKALEEAATLEPKSADVQGMLGHVYHAMGEYDKAMAHNERASVLDPAGLDGQDSRHDNALIYFYVLKKKDEAVQLLKKNLEINPDHAPSRDLLRIIGK